MWEEGGFRSGMCLCCFCIRDGVGLGLIVHRIVPCLGFVLVLVVRAFWLWYFVYVVLQFRGFLSRFRCLVCDILLSWFPMW